MVFHAGPLKRIVAVHFPATAEDMAFITVRLSIRTFLIEGSTLLDHGTFNTAGSPHGGGSYYYGHHDLLTRRLETESLSYHLAGAYTDTGELVTIGEGLDAIEVSGGASFPYSIGATNFASGGGRVAGPEIFPEPELQWAAPGGALSFPVAGSWQSGTAVSEITGHSFAGGVENINPDYPTAGILRSSSRLVSPARAVIDSLDVTISSASIAALPGVSFSLAAIETSIDTLAGIKTALFLLQRD